MATTTAPRRRIQPLRALRAMRSLLRNPDDTPKVFDIIDALSGNTGERTFQRFARSPVGGRVLRERRDLLATLGDTARLQTLPPGTLGRVYADFVAREQLSVQGLFDASMAGGRRRRDIGPDRQLFGDRLRDMHDLWHVVTGYGRDLLGEGALLAFSFAQTSNPGVGFIVAVAVFKADAPARRFLFAAWRRGRRARWLPAEDWEALLEQPLDAVRRELRLGTPPIYEPVRSAGAPAIA